MNLYDAIVQSCNVYFYELGARPGMMDRLAKFGADLGLGAPTGLGLNGEEGGFLPTEEWYREQKRKNPKAEGFQIGQALNAVIGQGSTRVTLLQMATLYAAIANGGKLWLPQIVERVESPDGQDAGGVRAARAPRAGGLARDAGDRPPGAGRRRQRDQGHGVQGAPRRTIEVAGKTGTAQVHGARTAERRRTSGTTTPGSSASRRPGGRKIAFAVLVEHGGHGGDVAAPLAMEIVDNYFETVAPADKEAPHVGLPRRRAPRRERGAARPRGASGAAPQAEPDARRATPRRPRHERRQGRRLAQAALPLRLDADAVGGWRSRRWG